MARLEDEGYIAQPHTSAGRIPTEKGYRLYLENIDENIRLDDADKRALRSMMKKIEDEDVEQGIKKLAKKIAELSKGAVVVGFSSDDVYYTGLANLFSQPEFNDPQQVYDLGLVIDHLDKVMERIFDQIEAVEVKIGSQNPFNAGCSIILTPWQIKKLKGIFGILGPMRMDYAHNLGLINLVYQTIY